MSTHRQEKAIAGAASAALSRLQKRMVCQAAAAAWEKAGRPHFCQGAAEPWALSKSAALELWRQEQQERITGRRHLTACGQADFPLLLAHFEQLGGKAASANHWQNRRAGDDARRARRALEAELASAFPTLVNPRAYVWQIARAKFKCGDLDRLSEKQLWTLLFDLRRAVAAKKRFPKLPGF